jgi:hypothetical protein
MDHIGHMPNAYLCALETLGNGDRTSARLMGLIDHFERATGLQNTPEMLPHLQDWRDATHRIAARRYYDFAV